MPPPQAKPIIFGYHCDGMETFSNRCSVMNVSMVVDGENVMNTDDKVDFLYNAINCLCLKSNVSYVIIL